MAFLLIFIVTVIRFCDRVDFDQVDYDVSHLKGVIWHFIVLVLIVAQPYIEPTFLHKFYQFYWFIQKLHDEQ